MTLSNELQRGKAAEHLVCANLILQGFSAFLADQGLPYDVVVEAYGQLYRVQVKSTMVLRLHRRAQTPAYRFCLRRGKHGKRLASGIDLFAFVALGTGEIAYLPARQVTRKGIPLQAIEFRPPTEIATRLYTNGTIRTYHDTRYIHKFPFATAIPERAA